MWDAIEQRKRSIVCRLNEPNTRDFLQQETNPPGVQRDNDDSAVLDEGLF